MKTYAIEHYTSACRDETNGAKGGNTGIQGISWKRDANGVPISVNFEVLTNGSYEKIHIGARDTTYSTPTVGENGVLAIKYASPTGTGDGTSYETPIGVVDAFSNLTAGDHLWLLGGVYDISPPSMSGGERGGIRITSTHGTDENPIVIESYTNEIAIFDGGFSTVDEVNTFPEGTDFGLYLNDVSYIYLRKVEATKMSRQGIYLKGTYSKIQGCHMHHNFLSGLSQTSKYLGTPSEETMDDYLLQGHCIVEDNISHHNSDEGCNTSSHDDGDNGDGLSFNDGFNNIARYNTLYANSDEGIDMWRSNYTIAEYNLVYDNPSTPKGSGAGIKLGGLITDADGTLVERSNYDDESTGFRYYATDESLTYIKLSDTNGDWDNGEPIGTNNTARFNIIYNISGSGIMSNSGKALTIHNNTIYKVGNAAADVANDTVIYDNIAKEYDRLGWNTTGSNATNNSWQIESAGEDPVAFLSEVSTEDNFLIPTDEAYQNIGVYADMTTNNEVGEITYSMGFNTNQSSQIVTTVPTEPYSIKVTLPDDIIYIYTDDRAGTRHLYIDSVEQATPDEITGNLTLDYVSQLTGGNIDERTKYEVYNVILTP